MRRPLGCMTFTALIAAVLTALVILVAAVVTGNGIFSPGALSGVARGDPIQGVSSHAELEARCDACHTVPLSSDHMADRCLACHTVVQQEISSKTGLHGRFDVVDDCRGCHTDHHGVTASLTVTDPDVFPHDQTGYSLRAHSRHAQGGDATCADCHPGSPASYTPAACLPCHQERDQPYMAIHVETFGTACLDCHDGIDSYGAAFDHATYPLTGAHGDAACGACHQGATTIEALQATKTDCVACHASDDIHDGRLGTSCGDCHTSATWTDAEIDHDRTRFPLVGQHVGVLCGSCHIDRQWTGIGLTCRNCHEADDPHGGQFAGDCADCHVATGWSDVTFDHATTGFALTGGHASPACAACHPNGRYAGTPTTCVGCHAGDDAHDGKFGTDCAACHKTTTWTDVNFDHAKTGFALTGGHASPACAACHPNGRFAGTPTTCIGCHAGDDAHKGAFGKGCAACHKTTTWNDVTFDHAKTGFALTGGHAKPACAACHPNGRFAGTPTTCIGCHAGDDAHKGAFGKDCAACHKATTWSDWTFDHAKSSFPLTGAHRSVSCQSCHVGGKFKGTPSTCASCHTRPASHGTVLSGGCATCHSTSAWKPASYDGPHTFPMNHGGAGGSCAKCHPSSFTTYSCTACHSKTTMAEHHKEVSGYSATTCAKCHPKGTSGD